VTLLALVVSTFLLTLFVVIEPLRRRGLSSEQMLALFAFTVPAMLGLTLPVAALFAATIVYGRFSQDRELLACRASGISTLRLVRPVLVLGALVTASSLALSNYVSPRLVAAAEQSVRANASEIFYRQLQAQGSVKYQRGLIRAEQVDPEEQVLYGVVGAQTDDDGHVEAIVASQARVQFVRGQAGPGRADAPLYAKVQPVGGTVLRADRYSTLRPEHLAPLYLEIPRQVERKLAFFTWRQLRQLLRDPVRHPSVQQELDELAEDLVHTRVVYDLIEQINAGKPVALERWGQRWELQAGRARRGSGAAAVLETDRSGEGAPRRVVLRRSSSPSDPPWEADRAKVSVGRTLQGRGISVAMQGPVQRGGAVYADHGARFDLPQGAVDAVGPDDVRALYDHPGQTPYPNIREALEKLRTERVTKLRREIVAEMHGRVAYGLSCFLLVAMGAALGLIFRGGQVVSAFALCVLPAAVVILMIVMGKQIVENPGAAGGVTAGLACIWGGDVLLLAANLLVYWRLARR